MATGNILTRLEDVASPAHTALVVIDVQNDFCHPEGAIGRSGNDLGLVQQILPGLSAFLLGARRLGVKPVFIRNVYSARYVPVSMREALERRGSKPNCLPGSWGAGFVESCGPEKDELVFEKHCYDATTNRRFTSFLKSGNYRTVVYCGVMTNVCVETTARSTAMAGYYLVVVEDCVASYDRESHRVTLRNLDKYFGRVVKSADLLAGWAR
ncbi:MAG: cysteine hydrolase [Chloroflexi bacterium]|nr:cysteine hydrolase [Chloroflexota bacterium]